MLAGEPGFEPRLPDPESGVLPLDDSPFLNVPEHDKRAFLSCQEGGHNVAIFSIALAESARHLIRDMIKDNLQQGYDEIT